MKKIKIGFFMDSYYPLYDGVTVVMDNYAKILSRFADVVVVVPKIGKVNNDNYDYKVIRVKSVKFSKEGYPCALPTIDIGLKQKLKDEHFDIIHLHSPFIMGKLGLEIARECDIPVVTTIHTQWQKEVRKHVKGNLINATIIKQINKVFDACDERYAVNQGIADLFKELGVKNKIKVTTNGTEFNLIENPEVTNKKINKMYKIGEDQKVLLFVGRINTLKNIYFILNVCNILSSKGFNYKMIFAGSGPDEKEFKKKIKDLNLGKDVIMTGNITDREKLRMLYQRADLFMFPSLFDASSLVQVEAASQKTPTIFIKGSITGSTAKDNVNAYFGENNEYLFAKKIVEIFANPKKHQKVCERAYKDLYKNWEMIVDEMYKNYLDVIKKYKKTK